MAVGGVYVDRIVEHFDRQTGGLGGLLGEHHGTGTGVEHHRYFCAIDTGRHREIPAIAAHDLDIASTSGHVAWHQFRQHAVADITQFEAVAVADHQQQSDHHPEQ